MNGCSFGLVAVTSTFLTVKEPSPESSTSARTSAVLIVLINIDEVVLRLVSKLSNGLDDELVGLRPGCLDCTSSAAPLDMYTGGTRLNATPATASENIKPAIVVNHLARNT